MIYQQIRVKVLNNTYHLLHTGATYIKVISIKPFEKFMVFWEVVFCQSQKYFANVGLHIEAKPWIKQ